jgi:hypothetical protein
MRRTRRISFPKPKKHLTFLAYKIDYDKNNLFDDIYKNSCRGWWAKDEIVVLQKDTQKNFLKIGRMLLQIMDNYSLTYKIPYLAKHFYSELKLKRTQMIKYIEAYNYCNFKYQQGTLTEDTINLGVEKLYLITRLETEENRENLEKFISDEELTVDQLSKLVEVLNGKSKAFEQAKRFKENYCSNENKN